MTDGPICDNKSRYNSPMMGDLLQTKLYLPPLRPFLVPRPHLITKINQGLTGKLTLISAPAGFGKTTLITEWLSEAAGKHIHVASLSLDVGDNDPTRFLAYVIAGLQTVDAHVGATAVAWLQSPQPPPMISVLTSLINDITCIAPPCLLILDDYHTINTQSIHDALAFLLENMPSHMHVVIMTRSDPPLPLLRLRVRGQITEIRQADLCFTPVEAAAFLNDVMRLSLTAEQVEMLETRTEGWIAGLQLAALSLRDRDDATMFVEAFSGSHRFVMDYLAEEVFQGLPDDWQQFILQTSILNQLNGALCEAVTGQTGGQEMLEKLEKANMFLIPLDDNRVWFRYHHLFKDVMANRLQRVSPEQIPELHLRAARWLQQNKLFTEAITHALFAKDYRLAAEIVESQALTVLKTGSITTLLGWLNQVPLEIINQRPKLGIASAWVYLLTGRLELIESYLSTAEKNLDGREDIAELHGEIAAIRAYQAAQLGLMDQAVDYAQVAFDLLAQDNLAVRCVVAFVLGGVYYIQQDFPRAIKAMKEASQLGVQAGNIHVAVSALSSAGDMLFQQGNLEESGRAYYQAMGLGTSRHGQPLPVTASVYSGLAMLHLAQDDIVDARLYALGGLELGEKWLNVDSQISCYLALAQIEHHAGHADNVQDALEKAKQLAATHHLTPGMEEQIVACETAVLAAPPKQALPRLLEPLSEHELKVLRLIAAGLSNQETAEQLYLSVNTVKWHLKNIYSKLDAHSRVEAIIHAQELGLL